MGDAHDRPHTRYGESLAGELLESPAAERNKQPILEVLERVLPRGGLVLEVASGTGQHVVHFARGLLELSWQPTEPDEALRAALERRRAAAGLPNVRAALALDVTRRPWPVTQADAIVCINMIHIAPWEAAEGLLEGAAEVLPAGAPLVLYGPFMIDGRHTAPSNAAFDASLRARNPAWGVRDLRDVRALAERCGFAYAERVAMPANNLTVVFRRS
ncbi:MAG TPA: DUF938 domain-containing protein [Gammaproteobacteria bacterium]